MRKRLDISQQGQALPLALVLLLAVAALMFFMFNTGQLVQDKIRLTNTADAVAYSAGIYEARVLNYDAYTNRAIIANEIAIGQAVGLASWTKYASVTSYNIAPYLNLIPYVGPIIANALNQFAQYADMYTYVFAATVMAHDAAVQALSASQYAVHGPSNTVALFNRKAVMDEVARRNDPDVTVDLIPLSDNFMGFTQRYTSKEERRRMGQVVHDSRDTFLVSRNWDFGLALKILGCKVGDQLKKRGSSELIELSEGWKSMDTLSFHHFSISFKRFRIRCGHSETPIGYATAFSDDNLDDSGISYANSRNDNPNASSYAEGEVATGFEPITIGGGAIPAFHDLSESALKEKDPRTQIAIRVTKPKASQRFSGGSSIIRPGGRLDLYKGAHVGAESAAISRAEVYFERPDGNNSPGGRAEIGSLFNPYWQVRLAPVTAFERGMALLKQGMLPL